MNATGDTPLGFGLLRALADVLRLSATTAVALRPFAVELFRTQTAFNHRLVDVLEDAVWTFSPEHLEQRLGPLAAAGPDVPNARGGLKGQLIVWTKRAGLVGLEAVLGDALQAHAQTNRQILDALKARTPLHLPRASFADKPLQGWFEAQADFYEAAARLVRELGEALVSPAAACALFGDRPLPPLPGLRANVQVLRAGDALDAAADVVLRLPVGETLAADTVNSVGALFAARPELKLCYGDTFFTTSQLPALKPGWSPEYLRSTNYIGGCFALRTSVAVRHGLDGSTDARGWLLAEPFTEGQVLRIPWVLSSRPAPEPQTLEPPPRLDGTPRVSIIVPFRDRVGLLRGLWGSMQRHDPGLPFELILASNQSEERATKEFLEGLNDPRVSWLEWNQPFNWSAINNAAARRATGELLLFLNNDVEITHGGWLRALAAYAANPEVGVAGARLLYEDGSLQHAGVVIGLRGLAGHVFARWRAEYGPTPFGSPEATRNWSAVTGACQLIRRALFEQLGGYDERFEVSGGDIELCLRARANGLRVVCAGDVELLHYESVSRRADPVPPGDIVREQAAYAGLLANGDPYYHPRLSAEAGHGSPGPILSRSKPVW